MKYDIIHRPSFSLVEVELDAGERIKAEPGAMVSMSDNIQVETETGGVFKALSRVVGGESLFMNTFYADGSPGTIELAPPYTGDIEALELEGTLYAQSGAFLASAADIEIETKFGGFKTFFAREGLFLLRLTGYGPLFLSSFGGIYKRKVENGKFIIDTGHIVAFTEGLDFNVRKIGGLKSTIFGGEGLVAEFNGNGTVYIQTRSVDSFINWLRPYLPKGND
ncbi:MAG: TIGR00266 family protein [Methanobacteriaceae archaeon]|nr:TIGR00266 family protein [Methanobacteriaceae archaeon]